MNLETAGFMKVYVMNDITSSNMFIRLMNVNCMRSNSSFADAVERRCVMPHLSLVSYSSC